MAKADPAWRLQSWLLLLGSWLARGGALPRPVAAALFQESTVAVRITARYSGVCLSARSGGGCGGASGPSIILMAYEIRCWGMGNSQRINVVEV